MISLSNRIACVGVVIRSPKQAGSQRTHLPVQIFSVALKRGISGFMNHADDAFAFHRVEIRTHHVVVREIHYVARGEDTRRNQKK